MYSSEECKNKSDSELVKMVLEDNEYFSCLMERYEKKLIHYLRRIIFVNMAEAEDILQEIFIQSYSNLNDFDSKYKFSSWIYRIAHNKAIDYYRKHKKEISQIDIDDEYNKDLLEIAKSALGADIEIKNKEQAEIVNEVLNTMPNDYREILVLRYLEERNYSEISDVLQKPMGTVSVILSRAKKMFLEKAIKLNLTIQDE